MIKSSEFIFTEILICCVGSNSSLGLTTQNSQSIALKMAVFGIVQKCSAR